MGRSRRSKRRCLPVVALCVIAASVAACSDDASRTSPTSAPPATTGIAPSTGTEPEVPAQLVKFGGCDELGSWMKARALDNVGPRGFGYYSGPQAGASAGASGSSSGSLPATGPDTSSTTNTQEAGIDEPDAVKITSDRVLVVNGGRVTRIAIDVGKPRLDGTLDLGPPDLLLKADFELLVSGDRALAVGRSSNAPTLDEHENQVLIDRDLEDKRTTTTTAGQPRSPVQTGLPGTELVLIDLAGPMRVIDRVTLQGADIDVRLVRDRAVVAVSASPAASRFIDGRGVPSEDLATETNRRIIEGLRAENWMPALRHEQGSVSTEPLVPCERMHHPSEFGGFSVLAVAAIPLADAPSRLDFSSSVGVVTSADSMYASKDHLVVTSQRWLTRSSRGNSTGDVFGSYTLIHAFDLTLPGPPRFLASTSVAGMSGRPFSMSELDGNLRITSELQVGSRYEERDVSLSVIAIGPDKLDTIGRIESLGVPSASAVRFIGRLAVIGGGSYQSGQSVSLVDLSDARAPRVVGNLALPGNDSYIHPISTSSLLTLGWLSMTVPIAADAGGSTPPSTRSVSMAKARIIDISDVRAPAVSSELDIADGSFSRDYKAFVWWPATGSAMVPLQVFSREGNSSAGLVVLDVSGSNISERGRVSHPVKVMQSGPIPTYISGVGVSDNAIVTVSTDRVQTNNLTTLEEIGHVDLS